MLIELVNRYLTSSVKMPYFLFISDGQYMVARNELSALGFDFVPLSSFCNDSDRLPDIDRLINYIKSPGVNAEGKKLVVTGLGEFLALRGSDEAKRTLSRLKDLSVGDAKVVLLLRGLASLIDWLRKDLRFDSRRFSIVENATCDLSFTLVAPSAGLSDLSSFKTMLEELENGLCGNVVMNTAVNLNNTIFTVHQINNAYEGIKFLTKDFALPRSCGSDARWAELLTELNQSNGSLDKVFEKHDFRNNLESNFYSRIAENNYRSWLYFIYLKSKTEILNNEYLRVVLENTSCFEDFAKNILKAIIGIRHTDERFPSFYRERKILMEKFPEADIADFVMNNRINKSESIHKLTDCTIVEREEIIACLSKNGMIPELAHIYPVLEDYLRRYVFKCTELSNLLTEYFEAYKRQKISNKLEPEFLKKIDQLARSREFNRLPTRNEIMNSVDNNDTFLYWLDALGVEYLGLIEALVQKHGLSVRINIARAKLPTITEVNQDFFNEWQGRKEKNKELDNIKHRDEGGYNFTNNELPIHLAKELDIIVAMVDKAVIELTTRRCQRFLIVSDHGASRLAVLRRKEEKYDTDTTGEYSGRCCKLFQPYDLPFAAEENGYIVLADYGRFKGSRAANVEVHGGASLEEVVVPVIELSLKDRSVTVNLVDEVVPLNYRDGVEIKLFFNSPVRDVSVILNEKFYSAFRVDSNHYSVKLLDIKRAGDYVADVYAGGNLIDKIKFKVQSRSGKVNSDFDDLF